MLLLTAGLVFGEVFFRYVLGNSLGWSEELVRYFLVWISFLGTYLAVKEDKNLEIKIIFNRLPLQIRKPLKYSADFFIIIFFIVFTYIGIQYANRFFWDLSPAIEIPMGIIYLSMPISGILIVVQTGLNIFKQLEKDRKK